MGDVIDLMKHRCSHIDQINKDVFEEAVSEHKRDISLSFILAVVDGTEYVVLADTEWGDGHVTDDLVSMAKEIEPMLRPGQALKVVRINSIPLDQFKWTENDLVWATKRTL